ncbi:MAG: amino acid amidase [Gemmatimonadetes bacterium]|nr:amino acid amidase [Gemmatimonadota bacterium]
MKIYISADIEGIAGIAHPSETDKSKADYGEFGKRMTKHVSAACQAAVEAGAHEILVNDAHDTGRNILHDDLPQCARLLRGWSEHPLMMVQELDESFDAVAMLGYHARAGSGGNPLSHTLSSARLDEMRINGREVAEFHLYAYAAASLGVPVVFVSGDEELCRDVHEANDNIVTVPTLEGIGASVIGRHPSIVEEEIRAGINRALRGDLNECELNLPERFVLELSYTRASEAYRASFYPGAELADTRLLRFETGEYFEVLRALTFVI